MQHSLHETIFRQFMRISLCTYESCSFTDAPLHELKYDAPLESQARYSASPRCPPLLMHFIMHEGYQYSHSAYRHEVTQFNCVRYSRRERDELHTPPSQTNSWCDSLCLTRLRTKSLEPLVVRARWVAPLCSIAAARASNALLPPIWIVPSLLNVSEKC